MKTYINIFRAERRVLIVVFLVAFVYALVVGYAGSYAVVEYLGSAVDHVIFDSPEQVTIYQKEFGK